MSAFHECEKCGSSYLGRACPTCLTSDAPTGPLAPGQTFRGLEILELLGAGGMGVVYKARQTALDRVVALKVLPPDKARVPGFEERFEREAKALAALSHPGIVAVHDFGREGDLFFIVMEFIDGANLRHAKVDPKRLVLEVLDALECAHRAGIVHRDLKPENILIDKSGRARLVDFGLAKHGDSGLTKSGGALGTAVYMAPEQMENPNAVDARADLYSLGIVMQELLAGERPVGAFKPANAVVRRAVERDPARRFRTAAEFRAALVGGRSGAPLLVAVAILALLAVGAFWKFRPRPKPKPAPPVAPREPESYRLRHEFRGCEGGVHGVAFSPDGSLLASVCQDMLLRLWETESGRERVKRQPDTGQPYAVQFHPSGRHVVVGGWINGLALNLEATEILRVLPATGRVRSLAYTRDGGTLACGSWSGFVGIIDVEAGKLLAQLRGHRRIVYAVAFSPDDSRLASGGEDGIVRIWNWREARDLRALSGHTGDIRALAFSPDGTRLASGSDDGTVRLWRVADGALEETLRHDGPARGVAFAGDRLVTGGGDRKVKIWDGNRAVQTLEVPQEVWSLAVSRDGRFVAAGTTDTPELDGRGPTLILLWEWRRP